MALWTRERAAEDVSGVIRPSDAGSQYTAIRYQDRPADAGAVASIGSVGDSYDNAVAESLIGPWRSVDDLELATLSRVHWFNTARAQRPRPQTPIEVEQEYYRSITTEQQRCRHNPPRYRPGDGSVPRSPAPPRPRPSSAW